MKSYKTSQSPDKTIRVVPTQRLVFLSGAVLMPLSLLAAIDPFFMYGIVDVGFGFIIFIMVDLFLSWKKMDHVEIGFPPVLRLSKGVTRQLKATVVNKDKALTSLTISLRLPEGLAAQKPDQTITSLKDPGPNPLTWDVEARLLGRYDLRNCYLQTASGSGLWTIRRVKDINCQARVYPQLTSAQGELASLFLNKGIGAHARSMIGRGREFEQLRDYIPGDSYEDIHWRATAKRNHPVTKTYQLERTQSVYLILDASRLSARRLEDSDENVKGATILEKYISAVLMMGQVSLRQGDHFGVLTFSNQVINFFKANSAQAHFNAVRDALYTLRPQIVSPDFSELFTFIGTRFRHRALLIFLTNLDDPLLSENFIDRVTIINRKHLLMVNSIKPRGCAELFSKPVGQSPDEIYERLAGHLVWDTAYKTKKILRSRHVEYSLFDKEHLIVDMVSQYMDVKQRQIL